MLLIIRKWLYLQQLSEIFLNICINLRNDVILIRPLSLLVVTRSKVTYTFFKNPQTVKLSLRLTRPFPSPLWFITHAIKPKRRLFLFLLHYSGGGARKHPAHNTNAHPTHWNQFPSFAKPDEEECCEIWACDKRDQRVRYSHSDGAQICHRCVCVCVCAKPRWPPQHCSPVSAGNVQLLHSGNSCCISRAGWILATVGANSIRSLAAISHLVELHLLPSWRA